MGARQLFRSIKTGTTSPNSKRVSSGGQHRRQEPWCLAGNFIDGAVWNVGTLGQYPTCYTHGALLVAIQLISVANTSVTMRLNGLNSLDLETKTGISPRATKRFSECLTEKLCQVSAVD
jgi:hypothetical protein